MKHFILCLLCLTFFSIQVSAAEENSQIYFKCLYEGGCQNQNDFDISDYMDGPYSYNRYLKELYACKKTFEGCTAEQLGKIEEHEISMRGISGAEFSEFLKSHPEEHGKGYFIPLALTDKELLMFAAGTSLGLVVFHYDQEIMDFIQDHKTETTAEVTKVGNLF